MPLLKLFLVQGLLLALNNHQRPEIKKNGGVNVQVSQLLETPHYPPPPRSSFN